MSNESRRLAGILLIVLPTVMYGGVRILSLLIGDPKYLDNPLRQDLWRAGHAHAGVWLILALVALRYVDEANLSNAMKWIVRGSIPIAATLVPAAFSYPSCRLTLRSRTGSSIWPMLAQWCWQSACSFSALASSGVRHNDLEVRRRRLIRRYRGKQRPVGAVPHSRNESLVVCSAKGTKLTITGSVPITPIWRTIPDRYNRHP
ncbi:hypothetical protein V1290_005968 [Bradyrhizobium sp. AZCC 1578]|uniref:hypothetical protein n=1 Tax=Bradyrhizobium sp. AZCC 1578 TaxID=3117027 RepID=UPI002FF2DEFD